MLKIPTLVELKRHGYKIATLTDLPSAMPDDLFKRDIEELLPYFDLYVSSFSGGFRKPNPQGLNDIVKHFDIGMDELVFVGDEEKDRKTAANAECEFVLKGTVKRRVFLLFQKIRAQGENRLSLRATG